MLLVTRIVQPKTGHEALFARTVAAMMPSYAAALGLPLRAYQSFGSTMRGAVRFVVLAEGLAHLAAVQAGENPDIVAQVDALRVEHTVGESEQTLQIVATAPAVPTGPPAIVWGVTARVDFDHMTDAVGNSTALVHRAVAIGAAFGMVTVPLTGPLAEVHLALGFASAEQFDAWNAASGTDEETQRLLRTGATYTSWASNGDYTATLWRLLG